MWPFKKKCTGQPTSITHEEWRVYLKIYDSHTLSHSTICLKDRVSSETIARWEAEEYLGGTAVFTKVGDDGFTYPVTVIAYKLEKKEL